MKRLNYIIAAYFGPRRVEYAPQVADRGLFMRRHLDRLMRLKHSIDRVTIVVQIDNNKIPIEVDRMMDRLSKWDFATNTIIRANDDGLSYSAFAAGVDASYEYTIFNEDDYVFTKNHFDEYLIHKLEDDRDAVLLCGCERNYADLKSHAAVCTGIARTSDVLNLPRDYSGQIPQVAWSRHLMQRGIIIDWLYDYATAYRLDDNGVRWIERTSHAAQDPFHISPVFKRALLVPVQALDEDPFIHYWNVNYLRRRARLGADGVIQEWLMP